MGIKKPVLGAWRPPIVNFNGIDDGYEVELQKSRGRGDQPRVISSSVLFNCPHAA